MLALNCNSLEVFRVMNFYAKRYFWAFNYYDMGHSWAFNCFSTLVLFGPQLAYHRSAQWPWTVVLPGHPLDLHSYTRGYLQFINCYFYQYLQVPNCNTIRVLFGLKLLYSTMVLVGHELLSAKGTLWPLTGII